MGQTPFLIRVCEVEAASLCKSCRAWLSSQLADLAMQPRCGACLTVLQTLVKFSLCSPSFPAAFHTSHISLRSQFDERDLHVCTLQMLAVRIRPPNNHRRPTLTAPVDTVLFLPVPVLRRGSPLPPFLLRLPLRILV